MWEVHWIEHKFVEEVISNTAELFEGGQVAVNIDGMFVYVVRNENLLWCLSTPATLINGYTSYIDKLILFRIVKICLSLSLYDFCINFNVIKVLRIFQCQCIISKKFDFE